MTLSSLQQAIVAAIAKNRSDNSYMAGGLVLNRDWPRQSDDIDIFQDTDEDIATIATRDIETLKKAGFAVVIDVFIYGCVEATVGQDGQSTLIQWMSESRQRFLPLVDDPAWGKRLHQTDLAINKVIAASTRRKARDYVDLVLIEERFSPLGPLIMAASGKPPHFSPVRIIDEIRHKGLSIGTAELQSVRGLREGYDAATIRGMLEQALDRAEAYVMAAPADLVGLLPVDTRGKPVPVADGVIAHEIRRATTEPDVLPAFSEGAGGWDDGEAVYP
jgi:hypothetical protein